MSFVAFNYYNFLIIKKNKNGYIFNDLKNYI